LLLLRMVVPGFASRSPATAMFMPPGGVTWSGYRGAPGSR
jgi:hypothetical protein